MAENLTAPGTYWHEELEEIVLVDNYNYFSFLSTYDDVVTVPLIESDLEKMTEISFKNFNKFLDIIRAAALRKASEDYQNVSTMYVKGWLLDQADKYTNPKDPNA